MSPRAKPPRSWSGCYQASELGSPLVLSVLPLDLGTAAQDYDLSARTFEIPAGPGSSGTAALSFAAILDEHIAEGDERMALRLVPPSGVRATLDQDLEVTIADAGGSPCPGVTIVGTLPAIEETDDGRLLQVTMFTLSVAGHDSGVLFDWEAPFVKLDFPGSGLFMGAVTEWVLASWPEQIRHSIQVKWWERIPLRLRFRSPHGTCDPAADRLECRGGGCILTGRPQ